MNKEQTIFFGESPRRVSVVIVPNRERGGVFQINDIDVDEGSRGLGLGSQAIREMVSRAKAQGAGKIIVNQVSHLAESFWRKQNFRKVRTQRPDQKMFEYRD